MPLPSRPRGIGRRFRAAALAALPAAAVLLAGCSYAYDDGLPPLGGRAASASASASAAAAASAAAQEASRRAQGRAWHAQNQQPGILEPPGDYGWASWILPDQSGQSLEFRVDTVWPGRAPRTLETDVPAGTVTVRFACRGSDTARLTVTTEADGRRSEPIALDFECRIPHARTIEVPRAMALGVTMAAVGSPANVAFRISRP
ncbi:hypothetical protein [Sinomonas halotolerans]|uniref:Lipoprotein n=1 Tax=Sinomonas halotolerans TaxID=1644133 RepID=A0ABU9X5D5_9MICC